MAHAAPADHSTGPGAGAIDEEELAKFSDLGESWWDPKGPMAPLHKLNPVRLAFFRDQACRRFGRDPRAMAPLAGLAALDVGCGGGLLAEPLARLGAEVTGIDPVAANIAAARRHALEAGLAIAYETATVEELASRGQGFDLVFASEVIEHVPDVPGFLAALAAATRAGGLVLLSTLSRTSASFLQAIVGAEYLLGWLPRGTHDWRRFLRPAELAQALRAQGLRPVAVQGIAYDAGRDAFTFSRDPSVNYLMAAAREGDGP